MRVKAHSAPGTDPATRIDGKAIAARTKRLVTVIRFYLAFLPCKIVFLAAPDAPQAAS
jgi:hypothetical protein